MGDESKHDEEGTAELSPQFDSRILHNGTDQQGQHVHRAVTTLDEVAEEHLWVIYHNPLWQMNLEIDLVGDQAVFASDGKLPPVIHLICPECAYAGHPDHALSITHTAAGGTKTFEIEPIANPDDYEVICDEKGVPAKGSKGGPAINKKRLTIKERFKCEYCSRRFKLTNNKMWPAR
jgi:uncharacterized Zn-finger protein